VEYIADTHALLWHLYGPQRLGKAARQVFSEADAGQACVYVPAVVVAEGLMVIQKGRLPGAALDQLLSQLEAMAVSENYPLRGLAFAPEYMEGQGVNSVLKHEPVTGGRFDAAWKFMEG
jgi:predicted nucleic acid-binding protein